MKLSMSTPKTPSSITVACPSSSDRPHLVRFLAGGLAESNLDLSHQDTQFWSVASTASQLERRHSMSFHVVYCILRIFVRTDVGAGLKMCFGLTGLSRSYVPAVLAKSISRYSTAQTPKLGWVDAVAPARGCETGVAFT
ncbi:hypothetical protein PCANC_00754 [Puccinia coronata f. sp. avenae]|uniref:Uncharacterized protein n=1 Tax=Puccinia coronata f. sp. avenae TaxID=200324 RepID=A0A2N5W6Y8_9BASI|nr:hypothetical protein PCANC_00754 [Puccinia coronata f. sp. avenae]